MIIEIDQSGKIENTSKNTAIAFSNDISGSILIPAKSWKVKDICLQIVRNSYLSFNFTIKRPGIWWILKRRMVTAGRHPTRSTTITANQESMSRGSIDIRGYSLILN